MIRKRESSDRKTAFPICVESLTFDLMMLRYHAFFGALGESDTQTAEWRALFAGLSVLRIVDRVAAKEDRRAPAEWPELYTSRNAVEAVSPGDPVRAILLRILGNIEARGAIDDETGADLLSYGRALDLEARWSLASDVFDSVRDIFRARGHAHLVIDASTALGAAARNAGDWSASDRAYTRAEHLAESTGDRPRFLIAQVGLAGSDMMRGNLQAADEDLDEVLAEAQALNLEAVQAIALHAKASVAHLKGDYQRTIHLAYRSLELTTNPAARERLLADIAAAYAGLGMREAARDGYSIVAMTSPHQWVRWQATLNLMELAIDEGDERSFDDYVRQIEPASLDPRLKAYFLFFRARGAQRFARDDAAKLFEDARRFSEEHKLNQISFEVETARLNPVQPSAELAEVAEVLEHLREKAAS